MRAPPSELPVAESGASWASAFNAWLKKRPCTDPNWGPKTDPEVMEQTLAILRRRNIFAVTSGPPALLERWKQAGGDRIIPALWLLALLYAHPQVHVDVGVVSYVLPRPEFHRYLQRIVGVGFGKRVMLGSDQMNWPLAIEVAIQAIETAPFLTAEQKRDILCNNAARLLRLWSEQLVAMREQRDH